jgi:LDH2 family malate/lactate/ureidoglycolate dehydrogenase
MSAAKFYIRADELERVARELLIRHDLPENDAATVAHCLVEADLRGVETHGVVRLTHYLNRVRLGLIKARPEITVTTVTPVAKLVDGDDGFGFVIAERAMQEAIESASVFGIGMVAVKNSSHFGMAASYVLQAERAGYMSMVFTNASRGMPPWGGREALLGTSPLAGGAPGGTEPSFVLDMSVAVAARGKIRLAQKRGESVPLGMGLDKDGNDTSDPAAILDGGVVLPTGGPKGSALAMMMDIFSGVFSGSAFGGDVTNHTEDFVKPQNVGHFIVAIKPDLFMPMEEFTDRMDTLTKRVKAVPTAQGFDEILVAGEFESRKAEQRLREGILLPDAEIEVIRAEAEKFGIDFPSVQAERFSA